MKKYIFASILRLYESIAAITFPYDRTIGYIAI